MKSLVLTRMITLIKGNRTVIFDKEELLTEIKKEIKEEVKKFSSGCEFVNPKAEKIIGIDFDSLKSNDYLLCSKDNKNIQFIIFDDDEDLEIDVFADILDGEISVVVENLCNESF